MAFYLLREKIIDGRRIAYCLFTIKSSFKSRRRETEDRLLDPTCVHRFKAKTIKISQKPVGFSGHSRN
jgi:hypothetical protein